MLAPPEAPDRLTVKVLLPLNGAALLIAIEIVRAAPSIGPRQGAASANVVRCPRRRSRSGREARRRSWRWSADAVHG
jgi:hypothetical protein